MRVTLNVLTAMMLCLILTTMGYGEKEQAAKSFSFLVTGDSRTEVYLTGGPDQVPEMKKLFDKTYGVCGLSRDFEFIFDPDTGALTRVNAPGSVLIYKDGWPVYYCVTHNGALINIMHDTGRKWVWNRIAADINRSTSGDGALFLLHGGDFIVDGSMGQSIDENPYWQLFQDEFLSRLPPPGKDLGLPGRVFGIIGNHEAYRDEMAEGFFSTFPWLAELGMKADYRIYSFAFRNCRFIFLNCGPGAEADWESEYPDFKTQMNYLTAELGKAVKDKADYAFITYHKPTYIQVGHDPLPADESPHKILKNFVKHLGIYVFNSHSHTTEQYLIDKVNYFVLGGGGASQNFRSSDHPSKEKELYWDGECRVEEYNYLKVKVNGAAIEGWLHRFRPNETGKPVSVVKMFPRQ